MKISQAQLNIVNKMLEHRRCVIFERNIAGVFAYMLAAPNMDPRSGRYECMAGTESLNKATVFNLIAWDLIEETEILIEKLPFFPKPATAYRLNLKTVQRLLDELKINKSS